MVRLSPLANRLWVVALAALMLLLGACSGDPVSRTERVTAATSIPAPDGLDADGTPVTLEVVDGGAATGLVITNHLGNTVYGVLDETPEMLVCLGDCVKSWIPVAPRAGSVGQGLDPTRYGAISRTDGIAQATYDGVPLYTWAGEDEVGITSGAGVAGIWYALTEQGGFVTSE